MTLALKYRPCSFSQVVGQKHVTPVLKKMVVSGQLPPALLFSGSRGTGKTSLGRITSAALNCVLEDGEACGSCASCRSVFTCSSLDVIEIDAASNGLVGDIRALKESALYSTIGRCRVFMLDEAHSMSKEAFNALLKILEEPPPDTLFILLTTEPNRIIDTVVSRTMAFDLRRIPSAAIEERLSYISSQENLDMPEEVLRAISLRVEGGLRDAVMTLEQAAMVGIKSLEEFDEMFGSANVAPELLKAAVFADRIRGFQLIQEYCEGCGDLSMLVSEMVAVIRDVMYVSEGAADHLPESRLKNAMTLSSAMSRDQQITAIRLLWELRSKVRLVDSDMRSSMEMVFVLLSSSVSAPMPDVPKKSSAPLSVAEMTGVIRERGFSIPRQTA